MFTSELKYLKSKLFTCIAIESSMFSSITKLVVWTISLFFQVKITFLNIHGKPKLDVNYCSVHPMLEIVLKLLQ